MLITRLLWVLVSLVVVVPLAHANDPVEPNAGTWKTWVISSGQDYRVPPPPGSAATQAELRSLAELTVQNDDADYARIAYWDAGAPAYRWMDWLNARATSGAPLPPFVHRAYTYLTLSMHDATIASWESKYAYNRQRPS